jgi:hypothetical protein
MLFEKIPAIIAQSAAAANVIGKSKAVSLSEETSLWHLPISFEGKFVLQEYLTSGLFIRRTLPTSNSSFLFSTR